MTAQRGTRALAAQPADPRARLVRAAHRLIDRLLGVDPDEVLNDGPPLPAPRDLGRRLRQVANEIRAQALDPETGAVHYDRLAASPAYAALRDLTRALPTCRPETLGDRPHRLAFFINLYNVLILDALLRYRPQGSLLEDRGFFRRAAYNLGGLRFSADDIEHGVLRGNRRHPFLPLPPFGPGDPRLRVAVRPPDPRIHFALVCGARSCPPIAFYDGERIESQLDQAASAFINGAGARYEPESGTLWLSRIFRWYQGDFGGRAGVLATVARYTTDDRLRASLAQGRVRVRYLPYDWSVNAVL